MCVGLWTGWFERDALSVFDVYVIAVHRYVANSFTLTPASMLGSNR